MRLSRERNPFQSVTNWKEMETEDNDDTRESNADASGEVPREEGRVYRTTRRG